MTNKIKLEDFQVELQKIKSHNGVKFVHYKKPNAPIAVTIASRSGSRYDPKGKEGLAHFMEHMVFEGSEKHPTKKSLSLLLEDIGGSFSATTTPESIRFEFTIAKTEQLELIADIADQIINKPLFLDKRIEFERKVIKTEISQKLDNYKRPLLNNIRKLMFDDSPLAHNTSGDEVTLDKIERSDLVDYLAHVFPHDLTVVSCGGCDINNVADAFSAFLPYKPFVQESLKLEINHAIKYGTTKMDDYKLLYGQLAFPTCKLDSTDTLPLRTLATYLARSRISLFKEILRQDKGLLYSINAGNFHFADTGYFHIDLSLKEENLEISLTKIKEAIESLNTNGIPENALTIIKNKVINSSAISMQTVQAWVDFQYYRELLIRDNNYNYDDFLNALNSIEQEDITRVSKKYLTKENMYLWVVGAIEKSRLEVFFT